MSKKERHQKLQELRAMQLEEKARTSSPNQLTDINHHSISK
jgi:hypothetical protein